MSDQLLQLGLDTENIRSELDKLSAKFESSMARNEKATQKVGGGIGRIGALLKGGLAAAGIQLTIQGLKSMGMLAVNVGANLEAASNRFAAGSKRLKAAQGGGAQNAGASIVAAAELEDLISRMKIGAGNMLFSFVAGVKTLGAGVSGVSSVVIDNAKKGAAAALEMLTGVKGQIVAIKPPSWLNTWWEKTKEGAEYIKDAAAEAAAPVVAAAADSDAGKIAIAAAKKIAEETKKAAEAAKAAAAQEAKNQAEAKKKGDDNLAKKEAVRVVEKKIAEAEKKGVVTNQEKSDLLTYQLDLAKAKRDVAYDELESDRVAQNAADAAVGSAAMAIEANQSALTKEAKAAHEKAASLTLEQQGLTHIAQLNEKIAGFDDQIANARRAGNTELEKSLTTQKNISKIQALAAAHAVTVREKLDERTRVRKEKAAAKKQQAKFEAVEREGDPIEFAARKLKEANAEADPTKKKKLIDEAGQVGPSARIAAEKAIEAEKKGETAKAAMGDASMTKDTGRRGQEAQAFRDSLSTSEKFLEDIKKNTANIGQNVR
jgi:hypothetical protein